MLEALQISGVFEPDGAVRPQVFAWDKPDKTKRRLGSVITLIALAVAIVGGASGTYYYVNDKRAKAARRVGEDPREGRHRPRLERPPLPRAERAVARKVVRSRVALSARGAHVAPRARLVGLLKGGENVAFEDGTQRAKEVGIEEKRLAFAYVASFLFQGDTAGAAAALAKWDGKADDDAWYQLIAGATFERAGDGARARTLCGSGEARSESRHRADPPRARHRGRRRPASRRRAREGAAGEVSRSRRGGDARGPRMGARPRARRAAGGGEGDRRQGRRASDAAEGGGACRSRAARDRAAQDGRGKGGAAEGPRGRRYPGHRGMARQHRARDGRRGARAQGRAHRGVVLRRLSARAHARGARGAARRASRRGTQGLRGAPARVTRRGDRDGRGRLREARRRAHAERARGAARGVEEAPLPRAADARSGAHGRQRAGASGRQGARDGRRRHAVGGPRRDGRCARGR